MLGAQTAIKQNGVGMIKGAIFDVDGTLLDSMEIWDTLGEDYLKSLGFSPKENLNETFKNMSLHQAAEYYISEYGVPLSVDEIMNGVNAMIENYYCHNALLKRGVLEFLKKLHEYGVKMCIATATDRPFIESALKRCGIRKYFSEIFTCNSVGHGKDEPFIYREALKALGTDRTNTVVFEDALYAAKTAKSDGFITVALYDVHEKNADKLKAIADCYITDYRNAESFWSFASRIE